MGFAAGVGAFFTFSFSVITTTGGGAAGACVPVFPLGALLLAAGTVWGDLAGTPPLHGGSGARRRCWRCSFWTSGLYAFFALPVEASYARPGEEGACTTGVYALCRHPGVLWFAGLYGCLWAAGGLPLWEAAVLSGLNVGLVIFEDRCVFPAKLKGYDDYRRTTPFLLPNRQSVRAWGRAGKKEVER